MKKKIKTTDIILILLFLAGLSLLLYPPVSNWWNTRNQNQSIEGYTQSVAELENEAYEQMLAQARCYNEELAERANSYALTDEQLARYTSLLDVSGTGVMGYVDIPSIDCTLPVYHGTEEAQLQVALGHLEWTSLPVGGESSHCVLSGHRGLPSAELLTNLDQVAPGDLFYVHVLGEKLTYCVDAINIVDPGDTTLLEIEQGRDYLTLLTCTPYGINSHRLLVRGVRIDNEAEELAQPHIASEVKQVDLIYLFPIGLILLVAVVGIIWLVEEKLLPKDYRGKRAVSRKTAKRKERGLK